MINLSRKSHDVLEIGGNTYPLDLSFDNVLRLLELQFDGNVHSLVKGYLALEMLTGVNLSDVITLEESFEVFKLVFDSYIANAKRADSIQYDLEGNPLPVKMSSDDMPDKLTYSLVYDADYIFASFMQAYGIDLVEQQGKLHWAKFNALIVGLPDDTKLMQVLRIRSWKPSKGDSKEHKENMRKLQLEYSLPEDVMY